MATLILKREGIKKKMKNDKPSLTTQNNNDVSRKFMALLLLSAISLLSTLPVRASIDDNESVKSKLSQISIPFIENQGQIDPSVKFYANTFAGQVYVTNNGEIIYTLSKTDNENFSSQEQKMISETKTLYPTTKNLQLKGWVIKEKVQGPKGLSPKGVDKAKTSVNYFIGNKKENWRSNIPSYQNVSLGQIYDGIELLLKANGNNVEKFFIIDPGADVSMIKMSLEDVNSIKVNGKGELEAETEHGTVNFSKPYAYQEIAGKRIEVAAAFYPLQESTSKLSYGFKVAYYDKDYPLVIDPYLVYSTYLGGSGNDAAGNIAIDTAGNIYIRGNTSSNDFPTISPIQGTNAGGCNIDGLCGDIFIAKINADGSALIYSTYLGGSGYDQGRDISVDDSGNVYVAGYTESLDFPTASPLQANLAGMQDVFVTKIDATGGNLVYSTYLGGTGMDGWVCAIAVDAAENAYITGETRSPDFPLASPLQGTHAGHYDAFVAKIDSSGSNLVYSTFFGGNGLDVAREIAIDSSGRVYITGWTNSSDFPTASPLQANIAGGVDAFVTKLDALGANIIFSTYLGGSDNEWGKNIALDTSENIYVAAWGNSIDFPTVSPIQGTNAGGCIEVSSPPQDCGDASISKIDSSGLSLVYSTYLGGSGFDKINDLAIDADNNVYLTGITYSDNFPTAFPIQNNNAGGRDAFVTKIDASGSSLAYSTYLGGSSEDGAGGIAVNSAGVAYIVGMTMSTDFPSVSPIYGANAGGNDAFLAKISDNLTFDTDGDGMPDSWEETNSLDPNDAADAIQDLDNDGLTNLEEYQNNTNPSNSDSDGDGTSDGDEVANGTDPNTAPSTKVPVHHGLWLIPSIFIGLYLLRRRKGQSA